MVSRYLRHSAAKSKKRLLIAAAFLCATGIYAINGSHDNQDSVFPSLISSAHAQEPNEATKTPLSTTPKECKIDQQKIKTIQQSTNGFFKNIRFVDKAYDTNKLSFNDSDGKAHTLAEFNGKTHLVNFWAVWCIPCRTEMPELSHLKHDMGGNDFDVLTINVDKVASKEKIQKFLNDVKADNLGFYRDETMEIFNQVRRDGLAIGLPVTMLIDKDGCLIGSFNGSAPWDNDDAKTLIKAAIAQDNSPAN